MNRIKSNFAYLKLITPIFPLVSLIFNIRCFNPKYSKWPLIFLVTVFGSVFIFPEEADASRHLQNVYDHYMDLSIENFLIESYHIFIFNPINGTNDDIFIHFISYFLGSVVEMPGLFFTVIGFCFGYFFISGLIKVFERKIVSDYSFFFLLFSAIFILYNFVDNINTVRTWTGAWVLFNGVFGYLDTKKKKYFILICLAPLIHTAYFVMFIPAVIGCVVRFKKSKFVLILYALSFLVNVSHSSVLNVVGKTELGKNKIHGYYISEDDHRYDQRNTESTDNWYKKYGKVESLKWASNAIVISFLLLGLFNRNKMNDLEFNLFVIGVLTLTWANFGSFIPAFYKRTTINGGLYLLSSFILLMFRGELLSDINSNLFKRILLNIIILLFIPFLIFKFANLLYYTNIYFIAFPFIGWFLESNFSIREVLGEILNV